MMKSPTTPLFVWLHVCSPAVFPMSPDRCILILALSYLAFKKSTASDQIGSLLKPWYKFTWRVDLGKLMHALEDFTHQGSHLVKKRLCVPSLFAKTVLFTVCFPAGEKPKLRGVVLRFGPTGVSVCLYVSRCSLRAPLCHGGQQP